MNNKQLSIFFEKLKQFVEDKELIKLVLSNKRDEFSDLKSIIATIVKLKAGYRLNIVYRHNTKDITKNYPFDEGLAIINEMYINNFQNGEIIANTENIILTTNQKGKIKLSIKEPTLQPLTSFNHDNIKDRLIETKQNIYLRELGITNANWAVRHQMSDKYKQINRYIELISPEIKELENLNKLHIVDMGSGKGYLTFALYDYLHNNLKKEIKFTGVEFREDLVNLCNTIAQKAEFKDLNFITGTIEKTVIDKIDVLIALHACDTATDEAIYRGINSDASLIVCAPCCHKQIRKEFNVTNELTHVVKYGILKERQAEIITDSLRALILEAYGYKTKVFEFISTEHTPKNVMIVGRKTDSTNPNKKNIMETIQAIKSIYGIEQHYLEKLLNI
ncbi:MAG TPA: SAM-dependent methyltransferase [Bacteroidales bacterium]|nr:SAM-dependent methyltransferase [Bacteroidales bacterium]